MSVARPRLEPVLKLLERPFGPSWRPKHASVLRSIVINSQWPQARLYDHMLADSNLCRLCLNEPGTLRHRWTCDATRVWWLQHVPQEIASLESSPGVLPVFIERAIAPSLDHLLPPPILTPQVHTHTPLVQGLFTGDIFIDGSGTHPTCEARRRVGSGAVMVDQAGKDFGSVYAPLPLARQTVPSGEAYGLYIVLQMAVPPVRAWVDCQSTIDGVMKGEDWACDESRPNAHLWTAIWNILRDFGVGQSGLTVIKTKGHATTSDIERGLSTVWERKCNDMADHLAKLGARCHPVNEQVEKVWPAYDAHIGLVAAHLARATARLGEEVGRDTEAKRRRKPPEARRRVRREEAAKRKREAMEKVWSWGLAGDPGDEELPVARHRLWEAPFFEPGHATSEGDQKGFLVYCSRCGAYAVEKPRALVGPCHGVATKGGKNQLARLKAGKFPHASRAWKELTLGRPRPISDAELLSRVPVARLERHALLEALAPVQEGLSLQEAMDAIGLSNAMVEAFYRDREARQCAADDGLL